MCHLIDGMQYRMQYNRDTDSYEKIATGKLKRGAEWHTVLGKSFIKEGVVMAKYE